MTDDAFHIHIDRIGDDGLEVDEPVSMDWLAETLGVHSPFRPARPGRLVLQLHRVDNIVHVRGRAALELRADCSRCLEEVELGIDAPVEVALFPDLAEPTASVDGELRAEDMGVATYSDDTVDLGVVIHDEVFLELPMSPVCSESCLGLCPTCGHNRNEQPCACELPVAESGWKMALRNLKLS